MSKRLVKKRKRKGQPQESKAQPIPPFVIVGVALAVAGVCVYFMLAQMFAPQNPLTAWDYRWQTIPSSGEPVRTFDEVREAYAFAARHPEVTDYLPCFCGCSTRYKHKGLTNCFVKGWTSDRYPVWESMGFT